MKTFSIDIRNSRNGAVGKFKKLLRKKLYSVEKIKGCESLKPHYLSNYLLEDGFAYDFEYHSEPEEINLILPKDWGRAIKMIDDV